MAANKPASPRANRLRMHQDIRKDFVRLTAIHEHGVPKYSLEYVINKVAYKYYKSAKTIENIVSLKVKL